MPSPRQSISPPIENVKCPVTVKLIIVSVTNRVTHDTATMLVDDGKTQKMSREVNTLKSVQNKWKEKNVMGEVSNRFSY